MTALEVDVRHRAGTFDLEVQLRLEGGLAVLFGPSGAGKSLTLGLIAGLVRPTAGSITIGGRVVADAAAHRHVRTQDRRIGMVFQDGLLLPHRNVVENVALAVRDGRSADERTATAVGWLERVGAADLVERRPGSLSGGQRQRVALARGLAGSPALLLLDEPLTSLDLDVRQELRHLVREVVTATAVPTLLVTHDHDEAEALGDVVVTYERGRVAGTRRVVRSP